MIKAPEPHAEYLRRNLLVCSAIGARAGADVALKRLRAQKRPAKWLLGMLEGVRERSDRLPNDLALWRDVAKDAP